MYGGTFSYLVILCVDYGCYSLRRAVTGFMAAARRAGRAQAAMPTAMLIACDASTQSQGMLLSVCRYSPSAFPQIMPSRVPAMSVAVLIICSLVCGCSGSTSGGIKIDRVLLAMKGIGIKVGSALSPRLVQVVRIDGEIRPYSQVSDAFGYIFCYLVIIVAAAAVNIAFGLDLTTGITASIACIGNVGPGFGEVGSMANYASFPVVLKFTCLLEMLIGRLEIFPVLYLMRTRGLFITS